MCSMGPGGGSGARCAAAGSTASVPNSEAARIATGLIVLARDGSPSHGNAPRVDPRCPPGARSSSPRPPLTESVLHEINEQLDLRREMPAVLINGDHVPLDAAPFFEHAHQPAAREVLGHVVIGQVSEA